MILNPADRAGAVACFHDSIHSVRATVWADDAVDGRTDRQTDKIAVQSKQNRLGAQDLLGITGGR